MNLYAYLLPVESHPIVINASSDCPGTGVGASRRATATAGGAGGGVAPRGRRSHRFVARLSHNSPMRSRTPTRPRTWKRSSWGPPRQRRVPSKTNELVGHVVPADDITFLRRPAGANALRPL